MANTILHKRSSSSGATPTAGQLTLGELALNTADGKLFMKNGAGSIIELSYRDARVDSRVQSLLGSVGYDIIPTADNTYSLGSASKMWKDVYVGPGSLYVNGQKVLEESSGNIIVSCDINQNLVLQTSGSGDVEIDPTGTGVIALKGPVQIQAGANIASSDGNAINFSNQIAVDSIRSKTNNTNLAFSAQGTGKIYLNDDAEVTGNLVVGGNLTISGTTTTINTETISLADNIIDLNSNFTSGNPTENAGIRIIRGDEANVQLRWNESSDVWQFTNDGTAYSAIVGLDATQTLTNKTINLSSNTLSGTVAQFNTALSDGDFATLAGTETLTNKTIAAGSNTITGLTNTNLSGSAGITNANLANSSVTIGSTSVSLGATATSLAGLTSVTSTGFTGALTGNADTATKWANSRTITLGGDLTGSVSIDGSANVTLTATVAANSVALGTDTTGNYVADVTAGTGISVSHVNGEGSTATVSIDSTVATLTGTQTLTNKTIALGSNTVSGTIAQFNTALTDADFATLAGTETLTNKTLTGPNVSGLYISDSSIIFEGSTDDAFETTLTVTDPTADRTITLPDATDTLVGRATTDTLTNKTINGANNTLTVRIANDVSGLGTGVATFLATPTSAHLAAAVTDETGSGALVFANSPTLVTPTLGVASATTINKVTITAPATGSTLTVQDGKTLNVANTLTFSGTDNSAVAFGTGGTVAYTGNKLSAFAATTSAELAGVISDETGTGNLVFSASPTFTGTANFAAISTSGNLVVGGDLTVNGTTTTINSTVVSVDDITFELGSVASPTDVTANGGGIVLKGTTDKSITWSSVGWTSSEDFNLVTGKAYEINGTSVLNATTLGSGVTGSSLTSVGTIGTGTWQGTVVGSTYGGTGVNNGGRTITLNTGNLTIAANAAGSSVTMPASGTLATLAGSETLTNKTIAAGSNTISGLTNSNLSGSAGITNANLANSTISGIALGSNLATLTMGVSGTGLSGSTTYNGSGAATFTVTSNATNANTASAIVARDASGNFSAGTISAALSGNASTATTLQTARNINGVSFNGSADITVTAAAGTLTGSTLASGVTASSLTSVGTLTGLTMGGTLTFANATSPNTNTILFGDNTGWNLRFMTSVSGTPTTRFTFGDNGNFTAVGSVTGSSFSGAGTGLTGTASSLSIGGNAATATTATTANGLNTANSYQVATLGVGTGTFGAAGSIRATNEITAYYSDKRLKENIKPIENALAKTLALHGVTYNANEVAESFGYTNKETQVGLLAQDVKAVLPEVVVPAPFDLTVKDGKEVSKSGEDYMTVKYEKIVALLVEAIKELNDKVESLEAQLGGSKTL